MKVVDGKIAEATENELYEYWMERELYDVIDFGGFLQANIRDGCIVNTESKE